MRHVALLFASLWWLAGIVIASGFWSTAFAVVMPLWAWYLVVERLMKVWGFA